MIFLLSSQQFSQVRLLPRQVCPLLPPHFQVLPYIVFYFLFFCFFIFVLNLTYLLIFYFPEKDFDILVFSYPLFALQFDNLTSLFPVLLACLQYAPLCLCVFSYSSIHAKNTIKRFMMENFFSLPPNSIYPYQLILLQNPVCPQHFLLRIFLQSIAFGYYPVVIENLHLPT